MSKVRVYEVAKQVGVSNKDLVNALAKLGIEVKNHMGSLTDEQVAKVLKVYENKKATKEPARGQRSNHKSQSSSKETKNVDAKNSDKKNEPSQAKTNNNQQKQGQSRNNQSTKDHNGHKQDRNQNNKQKQSQDNKNGSNTQHKNSNTQNKNTNTQNKNSNTQKNSNKQIKHNNSNKADSGKKQTDDEGEISIIKLPDTITIKDLSLKINKQSSDVIKALMLNGVMATANQELEFEMAQSIAEEFGFLTEHLEEVDILEEFFKEEPDLKEDLEPRPPVVVVMGHVDHGKTSLLDAIRESKVTEGEHGGITQHIGASVISNNGEKITFLDTPGHEAFTAMRLRGAMATDIAILVVAADDGVMPQTIEAINHARAAGVKIIVAVNKIDKPGANPDRVKQELVEYKLVAEEWGGDTICVDVSALEKTNLDQLLEMVLLVSEMEELKANPNKKARGTVVEARLDKGKGPIATVLVQNGTLKVGDAIVAGTAYGRIRAMIDDKGRRVKQAGPSTPVEVLGLSETPSAGDAFYTAKNEREARHVAEKVLEKNREKLLSHTPHKVTLDDLFNQIQAGDMKELNLVVKADVQGSLEAVKQSLVKLSNSEVMINVIHGGVGAINESDVMLASASNAIIIGFNVRPEVTAKVTADNEEIDIRLYRVIYNAIEDIEAAMKGLLDPEFVEKVTGHAEIRQTFKVSGVGTIAGAYVTDGKIVRKSNARLLRDNVVIYEGELDSLKRFKDDVKEVNSGYECGFTLSKYNDLKEGDVLEAFVLEEVPR